MTLEQLAQLNEKFQKQAGQLSELIPGGNMLEFSSMIIRSTRQLHAQISSLVGAKSEDAFHSGIDSLEEEIDEIIYMLDRLDDANRTRKIQFINDFVKKGYELLALYSKCCDMVIKKRLKKDEIDE